MTKASRTVDEITQLQVAVSIDSLRSCLCGSNSQTSEPEDASHKPFLPVTHVQTPDNG